MLVQTTGLSGRDLSGPAPAPALQLQQIGMIGRVADTDAFADHVQMCGQTLFYQLVQGANQRQSAFAAIEKAEIADNEIIPSIAESTSIGAACCPVCTDALDIAADGNFSKRSLGDWVQLGAIRGICCHHKVRLACRSLRHPGAQLFSGFGKEVGNQEIMVRSKRLQIPAVSNTRGQN